MKRLRFPFARSLRGQMLLAMAMALLLAQAVSAVLIYRAQQERREEGLIHNVAMRMIIAYRHFSDHPTDAARRHQTGDGAAGDTRPQDAGSAPGRGPPPPDGMPAFFEGMRGMRPEVTADFAIRPGDRRMPDAEAELRAMFAEQGMHTAQLIVLERPLMRDPYAIEQQARRAALFRHRQPIPGDEVVVAAAWRSPTRDWLVTRLLPPPNEPALLPTLIAQTLFIYIVLVGTMALIMRRIARPLAALTARLEHFTATRDPEGGLQPQGPDDLRRLIVAHNAMEARIIALLNEKDVMLGAIGHDLKTPLAALRVRIETVEDDAERERMAATIEDIARSLDDILSLARVGRPSDPLETTELSALVAAVVEEFEDMGEPVLLGETSRIVMPLRATWLRRALRNLVGNALRYGGGARIALTREANQGRGKGWAVIRIDDDGPGIPEDKMMHMFEPFTRGEPSRNSLTGGAGLGLTLARAIAEQHGGTLDLENRQGANGAVEGLTATLCLPL